MAPVWVEVRFSDECKVSVKFDAQHRVITTRQTLQSVQYS